MREYWWIYSHFHSHFRVESSGNIGIIGVFKWWLETELNRRHKDFQSSALPTELSSRTTESAAEASDRRSKLVESGPIASTHFFPDDSWGSSDTRIVPKREQNRTKILEVECSVFEPRRGMQPKQGSSKSFQAQKAKCYRPPYHYEKRTWFRHFGSDRSLASRRTGRGSSGGGPGDLLDGFGRGRLDAHRDPEP